VELRPNSEPQSLVALGLSAVDPGKPILKDISYCRMKSQAELNCVLEYQRVNLPVPTRSDRESREWRDSRNAQCSYCGLITSIGYRTVSGTTSSLVPAMLREYGDLTRATLTTYLPSREPRRYLYDI